MIPWNRPAVRAAGIAAALAVLTLLSLSPVLSNGFVRYDDHLYITENPMVGGGLTAEGIRRALTSTDLANWFPLTWVSHMLDVELYGFDPRGHHLTSLLLHAASTLLLWAALRAMTGACLRSALVAALFAVHPLHVESVAWAAERKDVLAGFFWMLSLLAHAAYARRPGPARYLAVVVGVACGLMAKPTVVTLPLALLLLDLWPLARWRRGARAAAALVLEKLPLLALSAAASVATYRAQELAGTVAPPGLGAASRLSTAALAAVRYLARTLWPRDLSVFYHYHMHRDEGRDALLAAAALAALTLLALRAWRRAPWMVTGWLWYLGTLVPMSGLVQVGVQSMADRYTYLPLVGVFIAASWGLAALAGASPARRNAVVVLAAASLPLLAAGSFRQARLWRDTPTLFENALRIDPNNVDARVILAGALIAEGRLREANGHLLAALRVNPRLPGVNAQIGYNNLRLGDRGEAIRGFRADIAVLPTARAHRYLAMLLQQEGRREEARQHYRESLRLDPRHLPARKELGLLLADEGSWAEALPHLREASRLDPADALIARRHREAQLRVADPRRR